MRVGGGNSNVEREQRMQKNGMMGLNEREEREKKDCLKLY